MNYELRRSLRKTLAIEIKADGSLLVRAPKTYPKYKIETFIKERFNFGLGDAIDTAAENGYIEEPNLEPVTSNTNITLAENNIEKIVDNINISTNIDSFLMDNYNLSVEFTFEFEETLKEYVDFDKLHHITLNDLIILDEENRIIYASTMMSQDKFNTFCNTHNLNYTFADHNENYMNCGLNFFPQNIVSSQNTVGLVYNIYTEEFPKSKKLNFYFNEITFTTQTYEGNNILENKTKTNEASFRDNATQFKNLTFHEIDVKEDGSIELIRRAETADDYFATLIW